MSANILQSYLIKLGTSVDRKGLDSFVGAVTSGISTVAKFGAAAVGAFGFVQAGIMKLASSESALNDMSERIDVSVESIERLGYVASQSGSSSGALQAALEGLSSKAGQAAMGMAGAGKAFADIGLNIRDSSGNIKSATVLFEDLGAALSGKDRNHQLAALDRLGIDRSLLKSMTTDVSGLKDEFDGLAKATGVDFAKTAKAASELTDEMGKTSTFIRLTSKVLGADLMGDTAKLLRRLRGWIVENSSGIQKSIGTAVKVINSGGILIGRTLQRIGEAITFLHKKTDGLSTAFFALSGIVALLGWPVSLIAAGIAAVVLVVDDLMTALEGGKTFFDWSPWLDDIRAAGRWLDDLAGKAKNELLIALKDVQNWLDRVAQAVGFQNLNDTIQIIVGALPGMMGDLGKLVAYLAGGAWEVVKGAFGAVGDAIEAVIVILKELSQFVVNVLTGDFSAAFENIKGIVGAFDGFMDKTFGRIKELVGGVLGVIGDTIGKVGELLGLSESAEEKDMAARERAADVEMETSLTPTYSPISPDSLITPAPAQYTAVGPHMLKTRPDLPPGSNPAFAAMREREASKVEITQTNSIEIKGMNNAQEIGDKVAQALGKVNRDISDEYRYSVGNM